MTMFNSKGERVSLEEKQKEEKKADKEKKK